MWGLVIIYETQEFFGFCELRLHSVKVGDTT